MKFVSLTVIKIEGNAIQNEVMGFANIHVTLPRKTKEGGTIFEYENRDNFTGKAVKIYEVAEDFNTVVNKLNDVNLSELEKLTELISLQQKSDSNIYASALAGDMVLNLNPNKINQVATSETWMHEITLELLDSKGNLHDWYSGKTEALIVDASSEGVASINIKNPQFIKGKSKVTVKGSFGKWVSGESATLIITDSVILGYTIAGDRAVITIN